MRTLLSSQDTATRFEGYEKLTLETKIAAVLKDNKPVEQAVEGDRVAVILEATPFTPKAAARWG